jgi:hypothetical protein
MKYELLAAHLRAQTGARVVMTFADVAAAAGGALPASAYRHRPWWANSRAQHAQARAWLDAGFRTEDVDMEGQRVVFAREASGVHEVPQAFDHGAAETEAAIPMHPMFGAMKGTFTIEPGWDLTNPVFDNEEMAEWEKRLEEKAEMYANPHRK